MPENDRFQGDESAASEIVGTLILIALVAGALALLATVLLSQPVPQKIPAVAIVISNESNVVRLYHQGGDPIPAGDMQISINGNPASFSGAGSDNVWVAGETLTAVSASLPQKVTLVYQSGAGQVVLASAAPETR